MEKKGDNMRKILKRCTGKAGWKAAYVYLCASMIITAGSRHPAAYVIAALLSAWAIGCLSLIGAVLAFYNTLTGDLFSIAAVAGIYLLSMLSKECTVNKWHFLFAALSASLFAVHFILNNSCRTQSSDPKGSAPVQG